MKKISLGVTAILAIGMIGCTQNESPEEFPDSNVRITLTGPEIFTRTGGDASAVDMLQYAIFEIKGEERILVAEKSIDSAVTFPVNLDFQLLNGHSYGFLFWAGSSQAPYSIDMENGTMSVDYTETVANTDILDGFYSYSTFTVAGNTGLDVTLMRPFAMVNVGIGEELSAETESSITISGASTGLNLFTGELSEETETATFASAPVPQGLTYSVEGYYYVAYTFVLATQEGASDYDVTYTYQEEDQGPESENVRQVTLRANYKTNLNKLN